MNGEGDGSFSQGTLAGPIGRGAPSRATVCRGGSALRGDAGPSAGQGTRLSCRAESGRASEAYTQAWRGRSIKTKRPPPSWRGAYNKKGPLEDLPQGARESSGDLLSRARRPGTIGDEGLDFRVRKGNGYDPLSITAETISWRHSVEKTLCTALKPW